MNLVQYNAFGRPVGAYAITRIVLAAPQPSPTVPAHHVLVLDASGSMWGDMDQMKAMLLRIFTATELKAPHLRVSLLSYSSAGDVVPHFVRASVAELQAVGGEPQRQVTALRARGLTCISQALRAATRLVKPGETTCVSLHTDGWANDPSPASERRDLLKAADELRAAGAWLSGIAYRTSSDFGLLSELASRCGGNAVLAADTRQVYDAIHTSTARAVGHVEPAIAIDVTAGSAVLFLSVSAGRCILQREPGTLAIPGLSPDDDRHAWVLTPVDAQPVPAMTDDAPIALRLALCRALLAQRDIAGAKGVLYGLRVPTLIERHARAMTPAALAALATDLDTALRTPPAEDPCVKPGLNRSEGASLLLILQTLDAAPAGSVWVHMPALLSDYQRRGLARTPGTRKGDGTIELPPVAAVKRTATDLLWQKLHSVELSDSQANASIMLTQPIGLVPTEKKYTHKLSDMISNVAGVDLTDLQQYRAYTVVADGAPTIKTLLLRVVDLRVRRKLDALGLRSVMAGRFSPPSLGYNIAPAALDEIYEINFADRSVLSPGMDTPQPGAVVSGADDQPVSGAWPEAALHLMAMITLRKVIDAALKGDGGGAKYTAEQIAALRGVCVTPAGYFSPPTTSVHADLTEALKSGEADVRVTYKVSTGLPLFPQGADDLYGANEFLQRHFQTGAGTPAIKLTWRDVLGGELIVAKERSSRLKLTHADAFMLPIYARLLGIVTQSAGPTPYVLSDSITRAVNCVSVLLLGRGAHKKLDAAARAELLSQEQKALREDIDSTRADLRPLVWLTATTGAVPSSLPHEALDADAYSKRYGVALDKAQREATFFVVGPQSAPLVIAVVPEAQPYTVRLPATDAASSIEAEPGA